MAKDDAIYIYGTGVCRFYCGADLARVLASKSIPLDIRLVYDLDESMTDKGVTKEFILDFCLQKPSITLVKRTKEIDAQSKIRVKYHNKKPFGWMSEEHLPNGLEFILDTNKAKFSALRTIENVDYERLKKDFGASERKIILAGSVKEDEITNAMDWYVSFSACFGEPTALLVAPRDERGIRLAKAHAEKNFYPCSFRSSYSFSGNKSSEMIILDTLGELRYFYSIASAAFIGSSMDPQENGSNPLEAAYFGIPVFFGQGMALNKELADGLLETGIGKMVRSFDELGYNLKQSLRSGVSEHVIQATKAYIGANMSGNDEYADFIVTKLNFKKR
ncbi:MAG: hypothetical protein QXK64_01685 [Candidatus Woesearchaeota archaeon]